MDKVSLKEDGSNFLDWEASLRNAAIADGKLRFLVDPPPAEPSSRATAAVKSSYDEYMRESYAIKNVLIYAMGDDLSRRLINMNAYEIYGRLADMFSQAPRILKYDAAARFFEAKLGKGQPVSPHVLKMIEYVETMERLGNTISKELAVDRVLHSLGDSFALFRVNYNMNNMNKSLHELHSALVQAEKDMKLSGSSSSRGDVLMISKKGKAKFKRKAEKPKPAPPASKGKGKVVKTNHPKPKKGATPDQACHYCSNVGHWKRNCPKFLEDKKTGRVTTDGNFSSNIHMIDINCTSQSVWVFDTGCGSHLCNHLQGLKDVRQLAKGDIDLRVGNGAKVAAISVGIYVIILPSGLELYLNNCYYVPTLSKNIISISVLDTEGFCFSIKNRILTFSFDDLVYGQAKSVSGIYILDTSNNIYHVENKKLKSGDPEQSYLWHCRLGHINEKRIKRLVSTGILKSFDYESFGICESCLLGKMTRAPFTGKGTRASDLLGLIHTDVCGPMTITARGGYNYFITFTDDLSRYGYVYLIRNKSEAFEKFKEFQNEVENQLDKKIKALRSDRGGEYLSYEFDDHLKDCGILSQLTPPGTPQLNGVSERRNRTLLDMVRSMMSQVELPDSFWGFGLLSASLLLNRSSTKAAAKTPYEIWKGKVPNMSFLKIWGCDAYVKSKSDNKLAPRSEKCMFVGYPKETRGYYFYNRHENKVFVAREAVFLEKEFVSRRHSGRKFELDEVQEPQTEQVTRENIPSVSDSLALPHIPRRSGRVIQAPDRYLGNIEKDSNSILLLLESNEPVTYKAAVSSPDSNQWINAMRSEMDSMYDNQVWDLVDLPEGVRPLHCKWIYKIKVGLDGKPSVFKARLVAKGFTQVHGLHYDETFAPVAMLRSVRIILAIAAFHDYEVWQMDVKTAFLNGFLEEEVYMIQPEGYVDTRDPKKVCKLKRSIYGLKQASRSWNHRFDHVIKQNGFTRSVEEPCLYMKVSGRKVVYLVLYVDDILLIGNDIPMLTSVKEWLAKHFQMKDLGQAERILGIRIYRDRSKRILALSQESYIDKVLERFSMENSKRGFLPMGHGITLSKTQCPVEPKDIERMKSIPYASAVGSIMYAMMCTRPDLSYALSMTSRYQANPGECHWIAVKNILKYLRRTKNLFLVFGGDSELGVKGYTDASFQTDRDDLKSQSGYVFVINGGAVSWKSSKQTVIADSTTEAEYVAASEAAKEAIWIKQFLEGLQVVPTPEDPVPLFCDNSGAIFQAKEPKSSNKSRHVLRKFHLIRDYVDRKDISICKVGTEDNIADPLTKPLTQSKHDSHVVSMGIRRLPNV
jgi:hypothetical protein